MIFTVATSNGNPCMQWVMMPVWTWPVTVTVTPSRSIGSVDISKYSILSQVSSRQDGSAPACTMPLSVMSPGAPDVAGDGVLSSGGVMVEPAEDVGAGRVADGPLAGDVAGLTAVVAAPPAGAP